jgi:hypothetical protein
MVNSIINYFLQLKHGLRSQLRLLTLKLRSAQMTGLMLGLGLYALCYAIYALYFGLSSSPFQTMMRHFMTEPNPLALNATHTPPIHHLYTTYAPMMLDLAVGISFAATGYALSYSQRLTHRASTLRQTIQHTWHRSRQNVVAWRNRALPLALSTLPTMAISQTYLHSTRLIKNIVANFTPLPIFLLWARVLPIGGWLEYARPMEGLDGLLYATYHNIESLALNIIRAVPQNTLHTLLERRSPENESALYLSALGLRPNLTIFNALLAAIAPSERLRFLTAIVGDTGWEAPLVHHFDREHELPFWEAMMAHLTPAQQITLVHTLDLKGDTLLHHQARKAFTPIMLKSVLAPLSVEQCKTYFSTLCPHGETPLILAFAHWQHYAAKEIFTFLPKAAWQDIMAVTPPGWSMNQGEKLMLVAKVTGCPDEVAYLRHEFNLQLPAQYQGLGEAELQQIISAIEKMSHGNSCETKQNFKLTYGETPEKILGLENWLAPKAYVNAYRQLQRIHHTDKTREPSTNSKSVQLNAAKQFITEVETRDKYFTQYKL